MVKIQNEKDLILHRLKIAKGHLKKIISMVDSDVYCVQVLQQSRAVQEALKIADTAIIKKHLKNCAVDKINKGQQEELLNELAEIFKYR